MTEVFALAYPGGTVELAPLDREDLQSLVQLTRKLMEPLLRSGFGFQWDLRLERALMNDLTRQPVVLVIRRLGGIIGYVSLAPGRPRAKLHALMIEPSHQQQGIGSAVLELVEDRARALRAREIVAAVQPNNRQGLEFLRHRGFADAGADGANVLLRKTLV
ncbi:MAG: GNAT family N-acetyltransferase [Bacillota bacterium]|nr:GNAT family N-acetyltransferase [Bacillota bacterium]